MEDSMPDVYVDSQMQPAVTIPGTWGELLGILDRQVAAEDRVVTAVRPDGAEETDFRHPSLAGRPLSGIRRIDVDTILTRTLFERCRADAEASADSIAGRVLDLASTFRQEDVSAGHPGLLQLSGDLRELLVLMQGIANTRAAHEDGPRTDAASIEERIADLASALVTLVTAQADHDWSTVADVLEYDLEPVLRRAMPTR